MASSTPSTALTKRPASDDTALMPPPSQPLTKRIKRPPKVLDEDTYTSALDHIIARDFFPGLLETRAQTEFLDALDSRDPAWISDAAGRLEQVMTPGPDGRRRRFGAGGRGRGTGFERGTPSTPGVRGRAAAAETPRGWGGETPATPLSRGGRGRGQGGETEEERRAREEEEGRDRQRAEMRGMSLNAFQAKYTSEDNESFNELLDRQNRRRAEKYRFLWDNNKIASGRQIAYREREQKLLKAEAEHGGPSVRNNDRALIRRNPETERDADTRKAMPDHRPAPPKNPLMFTPDSIEDELVTVAQAAQDASAAPPKAIVYGNTRLPTSSAEGPLENSVPASPSLSAVNDAIRGRPRPTPSEAAYAGSETPRVNGYAFVDEEDPEPEPEPRLLDSSLLQRLGVTADASPNPFTIAQASKREALHHRLVDKTAKAKRDGAASGGHGGGSRLAALKGESAAKTPTPKFASSPAVARRADNLTPAAQRLFAKVGTPRREGSGFGAWGAGAATPLRKEREKEKVRWTPTPKIKRAG